MTVTFATACWERDWETLLTHPDYLAQRQIGNHLYPFARKLLVINNVSHVLHVQERAKRSMEQGVLTDVVAAETIAPEVLSYFQLPELQPGWLYYNALAPLTAIYSCETPYLLYQTGDVRLDTPVDWIPQALDLLEQHPEIKVVNLTWNYRHEEVKRESYRRLGPFSLSKQGFSDQQFLVRTSDFKAPIYSHVCKRGDHFPRGDVFEKRVFCYMIREGWIRATYRLGSYTHINI